MARRHGSNRRRRRGSSGFFYKLLSVLLISAAIIAALTLFFKVEEVKIIGQERYSEEKILEISGVELGDNLFLLNKQNVASRIYQQLPYVAKVRINRALPNTILIEVTECEAVAAFVQGNAGWLISAGGKLVEQVTETAAAAYPLVYGATLVEPALGKPMVLEDERDKEQLLSLLTALGEAGMLSQVNAVDLSDVTNLAVEYAERFQVILPRGADFPLKLRKLQTVVDTLEDNEIGKIDMATEEQKTYFIPARG